MIKKSIILFFALAACQALYSDHPILKVYFGILIFPHSMPYMAALKINGTTDRILCGGSLVSQNYVLTAASCVQNAELIEVILGAHELSNSSEPQVHVTSTEFIIHEEFNETSLENDIALIKLPEPVKLNEVIQVVPIAQEDDMDGLIGTEGVTAGWGLVSYDYWLYSDELMALYMYIIENTECAMTYGDQIKDTNICTSSRNAGEGPQKICEGDFGGPLLTNDRKLLIGIASFTFDPCVLWHPNVFTNIAKYVEWIQENSDVVIGEE